MKAVTRPLAAEAMAESAPWKALALAAMVFRSWCMASGCAGSRQYDKGAVHVRWGGVGGACVLGQAREQYSE